jgi:two-component system, NtrC family, sensor kinase
VADVKEKTGKIRTPIAGIQSARSMVPGRESAETRESIFDRMNDSGPLVPATSNAEVGTGDRSIRARDLEAVLDISKAINSTLVLDEILQRVMRHAIDLLHAERGFLMLLDDRGHLQFRIAHNIRKEALDTEEDFRISRSIADRVAARGESEYTSNAQEDPRYAHQRSVAELNLRFIICVPLKVKDKVIGVCYLDNQSRAGLFGKSDLRLFELFSEQAAIAIENAKLYERLLSLKRYNENVVNKSPVGICVVDSDLRVLTFNDAAERIFHAPHDAWDAKSMVDEHQPLLDVIPAADRQWWQRSLGEVMERLKPLVKDKYFVTIGGSEMVLSIKISPLNGVKGERPKIIVVTEDITEKMILEKYVLLSEKMVAKGEMAAAIGHEINNHLEILTAHAELLPLHVKNNKLEKLPDSCAKILDSIDRMTRFTRGLMDYSQVDTDLVEYNLKDLVEEHLFTVRPLRRFATVQFQTDFDPDLPLVKLDVGQMQSVLLNLYNNAIDAAKEGESPRIDIAVAYRIEEQIVELRVTDHGCGIPPDTLPRMFEPRFTTKKTGHGLGLANCRTIVQNHGGTITVGSTFGVSTTFTVRLPARPSYSTFES